MLACLALTVSPVRAQGPQDWDVASGDWNVDANWLNAVVPDASFGDSALIGNGGTATLTNTAPDVGGVQVASGLLAISGSGKLNIVDASLSEPSSTGFLNVTGGTLTLSGNANVTAAGNLSLFGRTSVTGPDVTFSTQGNVGFALGGNYQANITSPTAHSVLTSTATANLAGTLSVSFDGVSPSVGDTWTIVDAATINGNFGTVRTVDTPLGNGLALVVNTVAGGNGSLAQLAVDARLHLEVDRQTGATTVKNLHANPIAIQGYTVRSGLGALNPADGAWNSLQDQGTANWFETASSANGLGELEASQGGSREIAATGQQLLGNAYDPLFAFGTSVLPEDLVFQYRTSTGDVLQGTVQYVGDYRLNNLVLTVDPATGNAQVRNASPTTAVKLQGYTLTSADGSLLTSFESTLPDSEWAETAGSANGVGELNFSDGETTLAPGDTFDLTGVFASGGTEDLVFRYRRLVAAAGDFNEDGVVNGADYTGSASSWSARFGDDLDGGDFLAWQRGFGSPAPGSGAITTGIVVYEESSLGSATLAAVPEPTGAALVQFLTLAMLWRKRRS
jgi:hypothetical protein